MPTGFTASKILWSKRHEPDLFGQVRSILLPHDYLNMNKKDGDLTSSETIEKLFVNYVDPKLAGL